MCMYIKIFTGIHRETSLLTFAVLLQNETLLFFCNKMRAGGNLSMINGLLTLY